MRTRLLLLVLVLSGCADLAEVEEGTWDEGPGTGFAPGGGADGVVPPAYAPLPEDASFDAPLAALFAPDDPVITTEVAMIERIIALRAADRTASTVEGQNPYRIRYAVYNLRNPLVIAALIRAHASNVDVQILIEAHQLDPAKDWNTADEELVARGFELEPDHRTLDATRRRTADLIGIVRSSLMHLKTRLYEAPGYAAVLTGSMNPGDEAVANEETLHLIREERIIERYRVAYQAVLESRTIPNRFDAAEPVNVLFTPAASGTPRAATQLLRWIAEENEQILIMCFSLRDFSAAGVSESLVDLLIRKAREGVPVYVITDRKQSDGVDQNGNRLMADDRTEDRLRAGGVRVYEAINEATPFTAMHHKVGIFGRTRIRVVTDAANWTVAGLGNRTSDARNVESVLFLDTDALDGGRTGRRYLAQWMRVLSRYAHQSARDGEPSYETVRDRLLAQRGWPAQSVRAEAIVETSFGESVWVRGDRAELGAWGPSGMALGTDGASYPRWTSVRAVSVPVGVPLAWKLVAGRTASSVRWERGANRDAWVAPTALADDDELTLRGRFR
jgi:phosphatidylserine/phosphatidylglycerophosphate/cardiolipin synthase-like enzyme